MPLTKSSSLLPGSIETHCLVQDFFFGEDLMLRRHDYRVNIAGGFAAAQLTSAHVGANGMRLPTKRRAYTRGSDRRPIPDGADGGRPEQRRGSRP